MGRGSGESIVDYGRVRPAIDPVFGAKPGIYWSSSTEAYAPGNPIFAVSSDDNLSGSSGADLFVFAQPIAHNKIYSFDTAADKIDLIGFGVSGFDGLSIAEDATVTR